MGLQSNVTFFNHEAILTQTAWVWFSFGIISLIQCCFLFGDGGHLRNVSLGATVQPCFPESTAGSNQWGAHFMDTQCFPARISRSFFFPFGLPVRWMILHLWIRKSTEICFRSRPWRPWVSWVLETRRFCCIGCESNVRKVYIFREANMNHKNNSYLRISTFQYICLWQWQAKTTAQLRVAWCIFTWFSDVGIDFKMYPCIDMQQRQECSDVEALGITFSRGLSITRCC